VVVRYIDRYQNFSTIDWIHDYVKERVRIRSLRSVEGIRGRIMCALDSVQAWILILIIGVYVIEKVFSIWQNMMEVLTTRNFTIKLAARRYLWSSGFDNLHRGSPPNRFEKWLLLAECPPLTTNMLSRCQLYQWH
jgi:hypothetical protein